MPAYARDIAVPNVGQFHIPAIEIAIAGQPRCRRALRIFADQNRSATPQRVVKPSLKFLTSCGERIQLYFSPALDPPPFGT